MAQKVHILDRERRALFNHLWDNGGYVLNFNSPGGFVDRLDVERYGWIIEPGWTNDPDESLPDES